MKEAYIAAKEQWARKMAGQAKPAARSTDRLPPGQRQVRNFPVLDRNILGFWKVRGSSNTADPWTGRKIGLQDRDALNRAKHLFRL